MAEITDLMQSKGIPCVPVNTPLGFANDEHVRAVVSWSRSSTPVSAAAKQAAMPFVIDGTRPPVGSVPPLDSWRSPAYISPVAAERREGPTGEM